MTNMSDNFYDRELTCRVCFASFTFTAEQQKQYAQLGYKDIEPAKCLKCNTSSERNRRNRSGSSDYE